MSTQRSTGKNKLRIIVVDDHPIVRQGFTQLINSEDDMEMVGEANDANEAMELAEKMKPDFAIVDISLKGTSGIDLTKSLLGVFPKLPVLIISMYDEGLYVERVLRAGARGYLMKQEATEKVIDAIRKVLAGELYVSEKMGDFLLQKFVTGQSPSLSR